MKRGKKGFTVVEILMVFAGMSFLALLLLWGNRGVYSYSRQVLARDLAKELNTLTQLYAVHLEQEKPLWTTKREALSVLGDSMPGTSIVLLEKGQKEALALIDWDERYQKFFVKEGKE